MKTIPPSCPEPESGPKYWRSLDQLADTPEFREWVEREFPAGASELTDPVTRRHFVKIMSASFMLAGFGLTGCRRPVEHIYPFSKMPEGYVHGRAKFYASARPTRGAAVPIVVKSNDGRPTKIEGNAQHPIGQSGTDAMTQASILNLYDPDRSTRFLRGGTAIAAQPAWEALAGLNARAKETGGEGLCFLLERSSSVSRGRLQQVLAERFPKAGWFIYEPVDFAVDAEGAARVFNKPLTPYYRFDQAQVILSLDSDFAGAEENAHLHMRDFAKGRRVARAGDGMNRLYAVEGLFTLTGMNADHRLRVPGGAVAGVAARVAQEILKEVSAGGLSEALASLAGSAKGVEKWVAACAADLAKHRGTSLVVAGYRQPLAVQALAHAMNAALGNVGKTVVYHEVPTFPAGTLGQLTEALQGGRVETLVIIGGNPVYNAPADLNWAEAQRKAKTVIRAGYYEDETSAQSQWHIPLAHYLESWGDLRTADGTLVPVQPLIEPLFGGVTELEVLGRLAGMDQPSGYEIVRETFRTVGGESEEKWKQFLHDGYLEQSGYPAGAGEPDWAAVTKAVAGAPRYSAPTADKLEIIFHRDYRVDDGRYNNNGWLQEFPDPITKLTWENVILLSVKTARDLGVYFEDRNRQELFVPWARIELEGRQVEGPVWVQPGMADSVLGVALGYGRKRTGRIGRGSGFDAYRLRSSSALYHASGAKLTKTERQHQVACAQNHWAMEGRPVIREANLQQFQEHPDFAKRMDMPLPPNTQPLYPNPLDSEKDKSLHQWGMAIDLSACLGCGACVIACQSENNVPIVGKDQVARSREMHWLRVDRYYAGSVEDPQAVTQPMLCQHCESAPCENVCPVNATVHDHEGLNVMVYNRCVGTRYCSNNCPYKVRRFNYFDYNRRNLNELYQNPMTKGLLSDEEWELKRFVKDPSRGSKPQDEWDLLRMAKNPDVSVRMRGVMEKCTFCVQRIEEAKISQKVKAAASGDVQVPEGAFTTACAQACPADAIVFGNLKDTQSAVAQAKENVRNYSVLEFLATKPRLTYLARVRNPNPEMPDYHDMPLTLSEFAKKNGDPLKGHHGSGGGEHKAEHGAERSVPEKGGHH